MQIDAATVLPQARLAGQGQGFRAETGRAESAPWRARSADSIHGIATMHAGAKARSMQRRREGPTSEEFDDLAFNPCTHR